MEFCLDCAQPLDECFCSGLVRESPPPAPPPEQDPFPSQCLTLLLRIANSSEMPLSFRARARVASSLPLYEGILPADDVPPNLDGLLIALLLDPVPPDSKLLPLAVEHLLAHLRLEGMQEEVTLRRMLVPEDDFLKKHAPHYEDEGYLLSWGVSTTSLFSSVSLDPRSSKIRSQLAELASDLGLTVVRAAGPGWYFLKRKPGELRLAHSTSTVSSIDPTLPKGAKPTQIRRPTDEERIVNPEGHSVAFLEEYYTDADADEIGVGAAADRYAEYRIKARYHACPQNMQNRCVDYAAAKNWSGFSCKRCPLANFENDHALVSEEHTLQYARGGRRSA